MLRKAHPTEERKYSGKTPIKKKIGEALIKGNGPFLEKKGARRMVVSLDKNGMAISQRQLSPLRKKHRVEPQVEGGRGPPPEAGRLNPGLEK